MIHRAVRFLYLNRTAFSGMYRLNKQGHFNVPYGGGQRTPKPLWEKNLLKIACHALQSSTLTTMDFEESIQNAGENDLIYCDPTYTTAHNNNGFIRYNEQNFSWADQIRLADACQKASERGAIVIVSNAYHCEIAKLYPNAQTCVLERMSCLCPKTSKRNAVKEYLFVFMARQT